MLNTVRILNPGFFCRCGKANNLKKDDFYGTTGYGHNDYGREVIERVYARIFKAEDALVRTQFISGTHALTVALFAYDAIQTKKELGEWKNDRAGSN